MSRKKGLTGRQRSALAAILAHSTVTDAAEAVGLSERTLRRYMDDPRFRAALAAAESDVIDQATRRLLALTDQAVNTLAGILSDPKSTAAVKLRAAGMVIDSLLRLRELAIEKRVSELEVLVYGHH